MKQLIGDWDQVIGGIFKSPESEVLRNQLRAESKKYAIRPGLANTLRAFYPELCSVDKFKVCVIGQCPYPTGNLATGIAFGVNKNDKVPPSLNYIIKALKEGDLIEDPKKFDITLQSISQQGVLFLNSALTVRYNEAGSHLGIWRPVTTMIMSELNNRFKNIVFIFMGAKAKEFRSLINPNKNHILSCDHPAKASYTGNVWKHNDVFVRTNEILGNKNKIIWN